MVFCPLHELVTKIYYNESGSLIRVFSSRSWARAVAVAVTVTAPNRPCINPFAFTSSKKGMDSETTNASEAASVPASFNENLTCLTGSITGGCFGARKMRTMRLMLTLMFMPGLRIAFLSFTIHSEFWYTSFSWLFLLSL